MKPNFRAFLEALWCPDDTAMNDGWLEEQFGTELVAALRAEEVLVPAGEANWYPCGDGEGWGEHCPRMVHIDMLPGTAKPHYAMCRDRMCSSVELTSADLRTSVLSCDALLHLLQRTIGLRDEPARPDPVVELAWCLGKQTVGSRKRQVIAVLRPATKALRADLAELRNRPGTLLVLLPTSDWISPDLARAYSGGAELELGFLEDRLMFEDGRFSWSEPAPVGAQLAAAPFAVAFDGGDPRPLTEDEYHREVKKAVGKVNVFVDLVIAKGRYFRAGRRYPDGTYKERWLSIGRAEVAAKLMACGRALEDHELRKGTGDKYKLLKRVRVLLDTPTGRYESMFFHTQPGGTGAARSHVFRPPKGTTYLLLCPPEFASR